MTSPTCRHAAATLRESLLTGLPMCHSQSVEISSQIRRTFNSIEGLTGAVDKLPVEQRFQLANVKAVPT